MFKQFAAHALSKQKMRLITGGDEMVEDAAGVTIDCGGGVSKTCDGSVCKGTDFSHCECDGNRKSCAVA